MKKMHVMDGGTCTSRQRCTNCEHNNTQDSRATEKKQQHTTRLKQKKELQQLVLLLSSCLCPHPKGLDIKITQFAGHVETT